MKGKEFYQILKERQTAGATDLTAATILEGAEAGEKFLLEGEEKVRVFADSHMGTRVFMERLGGSPGLLVFGAGHVGVELAWVLDRVGLRLAVFDERPEALRPENFPAGVRLMLGDYGHIGLPLTAVEPS